MQPVADEVNRSSAATRARVAGIEPCNPWALPNVRDSFRKEEKPYGKAAISIYCAHRLAKHCQASSQNPQSDKMKLNWYNCECNFIKLSENILQIPRPVYLKIRHGIMTQLWMQLHETIWNILQIPRPVYLKIRPGIMAQHFPTLIGKLVFQTLESGIFSAVGCSADATEIEKEKESALSSKSERLGSSAPRTSRYDI